jgi:putative glycosyltransferase (TIGR04348 family)
MARKAIRIFVVTPAGAGTRNGNRHTALRWAAMLRAAGHTVSVAVDWRGERCDMLIALHARRSHGSIVQFKKEFFEKKLVVVLTGTDLYRDLPGSAEARESLELADRLIVLQGEALRELDAPLRRKARVVYQSADPKLRHAPPKGCFRIVVIGHLRAEKDPLRAAMALHRISGEFPIQVNHVGAALDAAFVEKANRWMKKEPRYTWIGGVSHARALGWLARSHLLVVSSAMEGGANVIAEAARIGTPVIASRVSGNIGMLGRNYPGFYPLFDDRALADLLERAYENAHYYEKLKKTLQERKSLFSPSAERAALTAAIALPSRAPARSSSRSRRRPHSGSGRRGR